MGCCFSSDEDKAYQEGESEERRRLLDPVTNSGHERSKINDGNSAPNYQSTAKGDEQSTLNRILHQTANNVIDVSAMDAHLEQQEYMDRVKHYRSRLEIVCSNSQRSKKGPGLPSCGAPPQSVLNGPPVSTSDVQLITNLTNEASTCVKNISIDHQEDLVVPFGVP